MRQTVGYLQVYPRYELGTIEKKFRLYCLIPHALLSN